MSLYPYPNLRIHYSLSAILICEFSLELRRRNKPKIDQTQELGTLSWSFYNARSVLQRVHATVTAELGELDIPSATCFEMGVLEIDDSPDTPAPEMDHPRNQINIEPVILLKLEAIPATESFFSGGFP